MKTFKFGDIEYVDGVTLLEEYGMSAEMLRIAVRNGRINKYKFGGKALYMVSELPGLVVPAKKKG